MIRNLLSSLLARAEARGAARFRPSFGPGGAATVMFGVFLAGDLLAGALRMSTLAGFGFAAGSAAAAGWTRRRDLLVAAISPPVIFLAAVVCAELIILRLDHVPVSAGLVGVNVFVTLGTAAPWMFGGIAGALVIASVRGLPQCIRDLRAELLGRQAGG